MSIQFQMPEPVDEPPTDTSPDTSAVDPHQVESLVNGFIANKQAALFDAPDAYYRTSSADAVTGAPAIVGQLDALRHATLDSAGDDATRAALEPRLDAHLDDALDGVSRHVEAQRGVFHRQTLADRQGLIQRAAALEYDNDAKVAGLAAAQAGTAQQLAHLNGVAPDSPESAAIGTAARSQILRTAIDQRIAKGSGPQAIDLFDKVKAALTPADRRALEVPIGAASDDATTDAWLAREQGRDGALDERAGLDDALSDTQRRILHAKIAARESAAEASRVATVKGLDDRLGVTAQALATAPGAYRPGTLAALANAYEDSGATDSAAALRPVAGHEPLLLPFTQLAADRQTAALEAMPDTARPAAEAIQRDQAAAFARDPFAAGTALYADVGAPVSADDIAGRVRQARQIAERRGIAVAPFTADEIGGLKQTLAGGPPAERDAVVTRLDALPADMKAALAPLLAPPRAVAAPSDDGVQLAQADSGSTGDAQTKDRSVHLDTDFEAFKRALEQDRARVAAEHAAEVFGGAPPTEPAPGSPDDQAADADARRIEAAQDARDAAAPSSSANKASVAVPAAGAGGAGSAVGEVLKDVGAAAVRALPTIVRGASAPALAGAILLTPGNTGSTLQEIGDGLRVRINPDERAVRIERRVDNGLLGTGIGAKWQELPVEAEQVDTPAGRRIAIDGAGLKRAIGEEAFAGLSTIDGIAMAKPAPIEARRPRNDAEDDDDEDNDNDNRGRKRRRPRDDPRPLTEGEVIRPSDDDASSDEAPPPQLTKPYMPPHNLSDEEIDEIAESASDHAYDKHKKDHGEFRNLSNKLELIHLVKKIIKEHLEWKRLDDNRTAYWDEDSGTVVIHNPNVADQGTVHQPRDGKKYYDELK